MTHDELREAIARIVAQGKCKYMPEWTAEEWEGWRKIADRIMALIDGGGLDDAKAFNEIYKIATRALAESHKEDTRALVEICDVCEGLALTPPQKPLLGSTAATPNALTRKVMEETEAGVNVVDFGNVKELIDDLDSKPPEGDAL